MENVGIVFDGIPKTPCMIETERLDPVDFVLLPSVYTYNIFPYRIVFDIHAPLLI